MQIKRRRECIFYARGYCNEGSECRYTHSEESAAQGDQLRKRNPHHRTPCVFFRSGRCTKGEYCRFSHESGSSEDLSMSGRNSMEEDERSNIDCKFWREGQCLRDSCPYKHDFGLVVPVEFRYAPPLHVEKMILRDDSKYLSTSPPNNETFDLSDSYHRSNTSQSSQGDESPELVSDIYDIFASPVIYPRIRPQDASERLSDLLYSPISPRCYYWHKSGSESPTFLCPLCLLWDCTGDHGTSEADSTTSGDSKLDVIDEEMT